MYKNNIYKNFGKRIFDLIFSLSIIVPILLISLPFLLLVWIDDRHNPFYLARRVGRKLKPFPLIKIRSMVVKADKSNVISTKKNDPRITKVGLTIRKFKIDELPQIINIIFGQMSFVGPRPNTYKHGVELYTESELKQLDILPGITDFSSIIFSDEGNILSNSEDPDTDYNNLIRPWKSRLGLLYKDNCSLILDLKLIMLTAINIFNRKYALKEINKLLIKLTVDKELISVCLRNRKLYKKDPPS